jgi:hypothetical protein
MPDLAARINDAVFRANRFLNGLNYSLQYIGTRYDDVAVNVVIILNSREVVPADGPLDIAAASSVVKRYGQQAIDEGKTLSITLTPVFGPAIFTDAD